MPMELGWQPPGLCGWLLGDACCAVLDGFEAWVATAALVLGGEEIPSITLVSTGRAQDGNTLVCVCLDLMASAMHFQG